MAHDLANLRIDSTLGSRIRHRRVSLTSLSIFFFFFESERTGHVHAQSNFATCTWLLHIYDVIDLVRLN